MANLYLVFITFGERNEILGKLCGLKILMISLKKMYILQEHNGKKEQNEAWKEIIIVII